MPQEASTPTELKKNDKVSGKVIKTTLAGAVVDIGRDKPAVLPISRLRKERVRRVEEVLKEGDEVEAWVRRTQDDGGRIELTLIEPLALEWREIKKGMVLSGKVERIETFGAFVNLGAERPGLVHVSELSHDYVRTPQDAVKVGEEIEVQVLDVNRRKKQIKLSVKALQSKAEEIAEEEMDDTPTPTAMEMALRKAMDKGEAESAQAKREKAAKPKKKSEDMDEILTRTLKNRVKSK